VKTARVADTGDHETVHFSESVAKMKGIWGGPLSAVSLVLSIVLAIVPLAGIAWIIVRGSILSVDGLFMSLILLTVSGIFLLNASLELRDRGLLRFLRQDKTASPKEPPASKPA
jgi:hypothetical protein